MDFILNLLVSAGVIVLLAYALPQVHVKSFLTALWVAFLIGLFNATLGWIIRGVLNLVSFFLLEAIIGLIVTTLMIKIVDKLVRNFKVDGWWPALLIALATSIALAIVGWARGGDDDYAMLNNEPKTEQLYVQQNDGRSRQVSVF
ncbi:phage holin family protein [Pontibacter sp. JH31]|uniref:Phage holin family protein n=1 Tax=Pontibacter aquaedesilientis TaxID=2766980 RepID=A0ABR7XCU1_9BACT|nr:phage holin family protein [Pontibacter aquaedesilientis]MBD1396114.1 phage holin family protein [Pontibacter aquaedesilientis]